QMLKKIICSFFILSAVVALKANNYIDSLEHLIGKSESEKKVDTLLLLCEAYFSSDFNKSLSYSKEALKLSEQLNYQLGIAIVNNNIGYTLTDLGDFRAALEHYQISIDLFQQLGDENREAI